MSNLELKKKAEDLEKQLDMQLGVLKKESESWAKVGGAVLAGGLLVYGTKKAFGKKKKPKSKPKKSSPSSHSKGSHMRKPKRQKASFMGGFGKRLFMVALSLGQAKLIDVLSKKLNDEPKKS